MKQTKNTICTLIALLGISLITTHGVCGATITPTPTPKPTEQPTPGTSSTSPSIDDESDDASNVVDSTVDQANFLPQVLDTIPLGRLNEIRTGSDGDILGTAVELGTDKNVISAPAPQIKRLHTYIKGGYAIADLEWSENDQSGYDVSAWSVGGGLDYRLSDNLVIGLSSSYGESDIELAGDRGQVDVTGFSVAPYLSITAGHFYAQALYSYSNLSFDNIERRSRGDSASGETNGETHSGYLDAGYNFEFGNFTTGPTVGVNYSHAHVSGYTESGGDAFNFQYEGQDQESLVSTVGWQLSYKIKTSAFVLVPQVRAAWAHEYLDDNGSSQITLASEPSLYTGSDSFNTSSSRSQDEDYAILGAGFTALFYESISFQFDYNTQLGREDYEEHVFSARLGYRF